MKLTYQTSIATLIQFIVIVLLNMGTGAVSVVSKCSDQSGDCVSNLIDSLIYFLLIAFWFGFIWIIGYSAQNRRNKHMAQMLIAIECAVAIVALFNAFHATNILGLITSFIDVCLSLWVISLAYKLMRADGRRIVAKQSRHRNR